MLLRYIFGWIICIVYSAFFFCFKLDLYASAQNGDGFFKLNFRILYIPRFENVHCFYQICDHAGIGYWVIRSIKVWKYVLLIPNMRSHWYWVLGLRCFRENCITCNYSGPIIFLFSILFQKYQVNKVPKEPFCVNFEHRAFATYLDGGKKFHFY